MARRRATVLLRWYASVPDPVVKVGDWIADVTYERNQVDRAVALLVGDGSRPTAQSSAGGSTTRPTTPSGTTCPPSAASGTRSRRSLPPPTTDTDTWRHLSLDGRLRQPEPESRGRSLTRGRHALRDQRGPDRSQRRQRDPADDLPRCNVGTPCQLRSFARQCRAAASSRLPPSNREPIREALPNCNRSTAPPPARRDPGRDAGHRGRAGDHHDDPGADLPGGDRRGLGGPGVPAARRPAPPARRHHPRRPRRA